MDTPHADLASLSGSPHLAAWAWEALHPDVQVLVCLGETLQDRTASTVSVPSTLGESLLS